MTAAASTPRRRPPTKAAVFRACRDWHGYLSALAFLALIFFAASGLLLNHPDWLPERPAAKETRVVLDRQILADATEQGDPAPALAAALKNHAPVLGGFTSGEVFDGEAVLRFESPRGASDAVIDLATGAASVSVRPAGLPGVLTDLHRGKSAGASWKLLIDVLAILILAMSLAGYALFFMLRFRLRSSLILTGVSLAVAAVLFVTLVP
ncbi:MAG: PepSY-associated TM helix domain-containing protein [Phenylobacterium sp.]|uniref:PepSY-associated TM helix domain-containing protein n=1 Tax=Phenylobacterium sp. TaxID=1871053 RepID=UPI00391B3B7B